MAAHLCGQRCQEVLSGNYAFVASLKELGFNRVQVNATAANAVIVDGNSIPTYVENLKSCIKNVPGMEWIIQCNEETHSIWSELIKETPSNMSLLHDASCGKGVLVTSFPSPTLFPGLRCGYAGGIGPSSIESILSSLRTVVTGSNAATGSNGTVWVDMESSLRSLVATDAAAQTHRDVFSLDKCFACIQHAVAFGLPAV